MGRAPPGAPYGMRLPKGIYSPSLRAMSEAIQLMILEKSIIASDRLFLRHQLGCFTGVRNDG